jgi:TolB protein
MRCRPLGAFWPLPSLAEMPYARRLTHPRCVIASGLSLLAACSSATVIPTPPTTAAVNIARAAEPDEPHLANIRQITNGGENAEAYFSRDGQWITFQSSRDGRTCDQQYVMRQDGTGLRRVSNGNGKTTCGWFLPGGDRLFYGSSHMHDSLCPPKPDPSKGYVWPLDKFDIFTVKRDGSDMRRLTAYNAYTAEAVLSPDGRRIVFTSLKDGDLDIYTMNVDGSDVRQLTRTAGYDGGPWWSPDGTKIVYRAHHPQDSLELRQYRELLAQGFIRPSKVELFVMNADGTENRQITRLGGANFGPSWTPDGRRIIFASNHKNPRSRNFDLYLVDLDGRNLEQVTTNAEFDGFPMFSPNGKQLIWAANRFDAKGGETNLFIADWRQ